MRFIVETMAELNTAPFLGVNVSRGTVIEICQEDLRRSVIQEAIHSQAIREIRSAPRTAVPVSSRVIGRVEGPWKLSTGLGEKVEDLRRSVETLQKQASNSGEVKQLLQEMNLKLDKIAQPVLVVSPKEVSSGVVEVVAPTVPALAGDISAATAQVVIKEKAGGTVDETAKHLRALKGKNNGGSKA